MVEDVENFDPGGGGPKGVGELFQGGSTGGVVFWVRDVGPDTPGGAGSEKLLAKGRAKDHREAYKEAGVWELGIFSAESGNGISVI